MPQTYAADIVDGKGERRGKKDRKDIGCNKSSTKVVTRQDLEIPFTHS